MRTVWAELRERVSLCRALLMKRACSAIWESPISPSSSAFGISAATCHSDPIINDLTTYLYSRNEYICQNLQIETLYRPCTDLPTTILQVKGYLLSCIGLHKQKVSSIYTNALCKLQVHYMLHINKKTEAWRSTSQHPRWRETSVKWGHFILRL